MAVPDAESTTVTSIELKRTLEESGSDKDSVIVCDKADSVTEDCVDRNPIFTDDEPLPPQERSRESPMLLINSEVSMRSSFLLDGDGNGVGTWDFTHPEPMGCLLSFAFVASSRAIEHIRHSRCRGSEEGCCESKGLSSALGLAREGNRLGTSVCGVERGKAVDGKF